MGGTRGYWGRSRWAGPEDIEAGRGAGAGTHAHTGVPQPALMVGCCQHRRKFFEVFWYTHHLFAVYLVALGIHQYE